MYDAFVRHGDARCNGYIPYARFSCPKKRKDDRDELKNSLSGTGKHRYGYGVLGIALKCRECEKHRIPDAFLYFVRLVYERKVDKS